MNVKRITDCLDKIQWRYSVADEKTVITGYRCTVPFYEYSVPIEIRLTEHWVTIFALLQQEIAPDRLPTVASFLSALNSQCRSVRFFLVQDCAVLQAEVPASRFHIGSFMEALKNVCRYSSITGLEVSVLITNRSVADLYREIGLSSLPFFKLTSLRADEALSDFDISANKLTD